MNNYKNREYWENLHSSKQGELAAVGYKDLGEGFNRATYRVRRRALLTTIRSMAAPSIKSVLEGAVGIGAYGDVWQRLNVANWVGVDISSVAIKEVATRFPLGKFFSADLTSRNALDAIPVEDKFDLVTAIDVLYHIVDNDGFNQALYNLADRVGPGGFILVSDIFSTSENWVAPHVKCRPIGMYEDILHKMGFELIVREPVFSILGGTISDGEDRAFDKVARTLWKVIATISRKTPAQVGFLLGVVLSPIDALLKTTGISKGKNLEIAAFKRTSNSTT